MTAPISDARAIHAHLEEMKRVMNHLIETADLLQRWIYTPPPPEGVESHHIGTREQT